MWALTHVKRQSLSVSAFLSQSSITSYDGHKIFQLPRNHEVTSFFCLFLCFSYSCRRLYHSLHLVDFPHFHTAYVALSLAPGVLLSYPRPSKRPWECSSQAHITTSPDFTIPHWLLTWIFRQFYCLLPLDSQTSQQPCSVSISPSESWITSWTAKHLISFQRLFQNWPEPQISSLHSSDTPISSL